MTRLRQILQAVAARLEVRATQALKYLTAFRDDAIAAIEDLARVSNEVIADRDAQLAQLRQARDEAQRALTLAEEAKSALALELDHARVAASAVTELTSRCAGETITRLRDAIRDALAIMPGDGRDLADAHRDRSIILRGALGESPDGPGRVTGRED